MESKDYSSYQSKNWDNIKTLQELIEYNFYTCALDIDYNKHKLDECYGGFCLYFSHPNDIGRNYETMVGISSDGFVYIGDGRPNWDRTKIVKIDDAIDLLLKYRNVIDSMDSFERKLGEFTDTNYVNMIIGDNYRLENGNHFPRRFKNNIKEDK